VRIFAEKFPVSGCLFQAAHLQVVEFAEEKYFHGRPASGLCFL
jgi:hypothetical protein